MAIGSSPHTRGALETIAGHVDVPRIIPAYAGSTRGGRLVIADVVRIIPAYAGSTLKACAPPSITADHPRIRGEHLLAERSVRVVRGSSPHTRGAPAASHHALEEIRIIPAYAGSTPWRSRPPQRTRDHPRIRGEHWSWLALPCLTPPDHPRIRGEHAAL